MKATLHIQLLGDFSLAANDAPLTGANTPRLQSLLAYLLLHRDAPQSRTHLAFQFWPDSTEAQARSNLRTLLHRLRTGLPDASTFLHVDAHTVQWRPDAPFVLDVAEFEAALDQAETAQQAGNEADEQATLEQAVSLYSGDLLPSCYDDWLLPHRERLLQAYLRALERLVEILEGQRQYDTAIRYAGRLLRHDPLHEAGYRRLMRLHALKGDRAGALRVYHTCATALQRELGVEPGLATQRAYEDLLQAEARPVPAARATPGVSPLVGREEEWNELQTAWRRARRGPRFVLLQGEAGIGKTRLVEELLAWAERQGIAHAYARCYAAEGELAYAPVVSLLQANPLPSLDDVWLSEVARLLPEVLAERPDVPPPQPMTEAWQRQRLFRALAQAVLGDGSSPPPLLLAVEDLQWCDRETLDWLHYLLRVDPRARLLVVGSCRPEELGDDCPLTAALPALYRDARLTEIELGPLNEAQTAALATATAGQELESTMTRRLYHETEGNPLFVVETVRAGLPTRQDGTETEGMSLPPRAQAVLEARLAQLSPASKELAGLAATIGRSFTIPVLQQAGDGDEDALVQGLDELWQRRIVRERGLDSYDFSHDRLRDVAYATLSPARRRMLHRHAAQAMETVYASDLDPVSRQVASHYRQAGLPGQAIPYYLRAGQVAARLYATDEAETCFRRGLDLLQQGVWDPTQQDWRRDMAAGLWEGLGNALLLGNPGEGRVAFQNALQEVGQDDLLRQARLQRLLGLTWDRQGQFDKALHDYDRAEASLGAEPPNPATAWWREWLDLQYNRNYSLYALARWREIVLSWERVQIVAEQHGTAADRFWLSSSRLIIELRRDRYLISDETMANIQAGVAFALETGDSALVAHARFSVGWFLVLRGELEGAEQPLQATVALCDQIEYPLYAAWALIWLTVLHRRRGQVDKTRRYAQRTLETASTGGIPEQVAMAQANLCWVAWRMREMGEAEELGRTALDLWQKCQWVYAFQWTARLPLLAMALERDQIPKALEHAQDMLDPQQQKLPEPFNAALEAAVQAGDNDQPEEARQYLERAVTVAQETGFLYSHPGLAVLQRDAVARLPVFQVPLSYY